MTSEKAKYSGVQHLTVTSDQAGRRIDNYLTGHFTEIPRTRIYKMLRKGEVRVNSARVKQDYRIMTNDIIRVPPVYTRPKTAYEYQPPVQLLDQVANAIVYEDEFLLVMNKPAGLAVHGGKTEKSGLIEILRKLRPADAGLELVHRLDKQTSGCLLIARDHRTLRKLHNLLREHKVKKHYLALLRGNLRTAQEITKPLRKNELRSGQRLVQVDNAGKQAITRFHPVTRYRQANLVQVEIATGRMHQIRVHAASMGHPVAGDDKYGDREFNKSMKLIGLNRMFLHAGSLTLKLPYSGQVKTFEAPLPDDLGEVLNKL
jgi:23S rRNA pseudouridine955/2504/2580 synthase